MTNVDDQAGRDSPAGRQIQEPPWERFREPHRKSAVPVEQHMWLHAIETGAAVAAAVFLAAVALPHAWPLWIITSAFAAVTAVTGYVALTITTTLGIPAYLVTWGIVLTGWITAARLAGPWHADVIAGLLLPAVVLAPLGAVVISRHRDRVRRLAEAGRETQNTRELRYWERTLAGLGIDGVTILDVVKHKGGYQVFGRLGKGAGGQRPHTFDALKQVAPLLAVQKRLAADSVYFEQPPDSPGGSADFVMHVREKSGKRETVYMPAENRPLTINRPLGLGVLDSMKEFTLLIREVIVLLIGVRGAGKALTLDTRIPTLSGWTTMGEIKAGDLVFDEAGLPCQVIAATDVMHGRPCYEVEFSDGTVITADAGHQWLVDTDSSRRSERRSRGSNRKPRRRPDLEMNHGQGHLRKRPEVVTTAQMVGALRMLRRSGVTADGGVNNYSIRVAAPLQCLQAELPVPPYTLGAWLGDGWSATGAITTADPEILTEIETEGEIVWIMPSTVAGEPPRQPAVCALISTSCSPSGKVVGRKLCANHYEVEKRAGRLDQWPCRERDTGRREQVAGYRIGGLQVRLRDAGVLGDKHIPVSYLRASEVQRRALLAGLLDTDGCCLKSGAVEFSNSCERLARDTYHLVCSLGYKASLRGKTARLNGKDCRISWTVSFTPAGKVFRLPRKLARQVISTRSTARHRYITAIRPVPSVPVRCIQVDSPNSLYLAGEACVPTHNSNAMNVFLAQAGRCVDTVIFMIDLKGGRAARPWMMSWVRGHAKRPVIDWLATTREEADLMLDALLAVIDCRSRSGRGWEKITPTADDPAFLLFCDETAVMTGHGIRADGLSNYTMARKLAQIAETGRSEAVDIICAALRGNVDIMGSTAVKAMTEVKIGLRVTTPADGQSIFPDDNAAAVALSRLRDPGDALVRVGPDISPPVHFYRIDGEDQIDKVALFAGNLRPAPEDAAITAMGEAYEQRWSRPHGQALLQQWRTDAGVPEPRMIDPDFEEIIAGIEDPEAPVDPRRKRMRELLMKRGLQGYTVKMLGRLLANEGLTTPRQTIHDWLADDKRSGYVRSTGQPSNRWIWVFPGDERDVPGMS